MIKYVCIGIWMLVGSLKSFAQLGNPFIHNFPPSDYQNESYITSPQNWGVIQDNRGVMYISNTSGVLEYDGQHWQLVQGTGYSGNFQFAKNRQGRVYVGSNEDLGYLGNDPEGRVQFVSLRPHLQRDYPDLRVNKMAAIGDEVYFSTPQNIFRWTGKRFKVWTSTAGYSRIFTSHNKLYTIDKAKGLCVLEQERFKPLPGGEGFDTLDVVALLPLPATSASRMNFVVVTFGDGLFTYQDHALQALHTTPSDILEQVYYMDGVPLADGTFALATIGAGVVVIDPAGAVKKVINKQTGLTDNAAIGLYRDREDGLWVASNIGVSRINYPSPITFLNETSGLEGVVLDVLKQKHRLYAGTTSGLYVANEEDAEPQFRPVPQIHKEVWQLLDVGDTLLVVNSLGVYVLVGQKLKRLSPATETITYKTVLRSKTNPRQFYVGSSAGLAVVTHHGNQWRWQGNVMGVNHDIRDLAEDRNGTIWATCDTTISAIHGTGGRGLRLPFRNYQPSDALIAKLNKFQVSSVGGKIYFGTSKGIYTLQQRNGRMLLLPDSTFGAQFADGSREAINLTEDRQGHIWLTSEHRTGMLRERAGNSYDWDTIPLSRIPREDVWNIHSDDQGILWLGTTVGIFKYDPYVPKNYNTRQHTVLRKVNLLGDSTVFYGTFMRRNAPTVRQTPRFKFVLPHAIKSINFEYTATSYDAPEQLLYSYMLEGVDDSWSHWTTETKKEFLGLDEGNYVFKVKSKNIYGTENIAATFAFESLPPFYRTWWAYSFYVLLYGLVIWGFIKVKHRNLIAKQRSLENLVHERTAQLELEKKKSDDLLLNILPAETADELKANGRTVARSYKQATVLFTDFKDFTKISEDLSPEELVAIIDFYFCAFDRIISKYSIEKIKTIGDAYMCVGGIPNPEANTPADVVRAGLEILQFVKNLYPNNGQLKKHKFEIRIGIHTGPVVAGVVGTTKFAYDVWGDTVNTAARMESCAEVGKVNISGATYHLIQHEFLCTYRGKVEAKNKGDIDMYFVEAAVEQPVMQ